MLEFQPKRDAFEAAILKRSRADQLVLVVDAGGDLPDTLDQYWTETSIVEPARAASLTADVMADFRTATTIACADQAQLLARRRPLLVAFPQTVSHAQAQFAVELANRGVDVLVCAERAALEQLIDDPASIHAR
jgi:hypothetical protein